MHSYLRAIGFSNIKSRKQLEQIYVSTLRNPNRKIITTISVDTSLIQFEKDFAPSLGLTLIGEYDVNGAMVIAPEDAGSYNLSPPDGLIGKAGHFLVDMLPWYLWGNAPNDSTTIGERIFVPIGLAVKSLWR